MVKENSYINIQAFMVNDLHLKGNELLIYAIIHGFSQDGESEFTGSLQYLADWTNSTKQGVMKALKSLLEKQLILKAETFQNNLKFCTYKVAQYETKFNGSGKQSLIEYETKFNGGSKQSLPNNITDTTTNTITDNKECKNKKHKYGEYKNVLLTDIEKQKLDKKLGEEKTLAVIEHYSTKKEMKGYHYNSDYLAILNWGIKSYEESSTPKNQTSQNGGYVNNKRPASDNNVGEIPF